MGLMLLMCRELLSERGDAKKNIKINQLIETLRKHYESLSNALKVFANSIYGENGYIFSPLYKKEISLSVIAFARYCLRLVIEYAK
ncbi:11337_t:CDS:1, partial [Scutellospora calospora]